ncbi:NmrA family NAD(P)-binding protein [Enterovibrio makurazakiensis]|uniref:NmrA family NAD(P)-binding protein n=1 Tax=Enterovibrio makurazakiensis TaxID=2910232 RepID=UPI003D2144C2
MSKSKLYVVTGVSGRTGAAAARALLNVGMRVRVIVRDEDKGDIWAAQGAEVAIADLTNTSSLYKALIGADGAYIVSPPQYYLDNLFEQAESMAHSIAEAATKAQLPKLVALSSIGAEQSSGTGWIAMNRLLEQRLNQTDLSIAYLRAAYFMENWGPLAQIAATQGELPSFLAPLNQKLPMIATEDIGRIAAEILCENWDGTRIIELEGPDRYSPNEVAVILTKALDKMIKPITIPESDWIQFISGQDFSTVAIAGFIEMTQGLNSKHIAFGNSNIERRQGTVSLDTVVSAMHI